MVLSNHTYVLLEDNSLWSMGNNEYGQLGIGKMGDTYHTPQKIMENVLAVTNGAHHGIILDYRGRLFGVGDNRFGQLGIESKGEYFPKEVDLKQYMLDADGNKIPRLDSKGLVLKDTMGATLYKFEYVTFVQITAGANHSAALDKDGNVWITGASNKFQSAPFESTISFNVPYVQNWTKLVIIDTDTGLKVKCCDVQCGHDFTMVLSDDRKSLYGWGCNDRGELGLGESISTSNPRKILAAIDQDTVLRLVNLQQTGQLNNSALVTAALTDMTTVVSGVPITKAPLDRLEPNKFIKIQVVSRTTFALENDGTLWTWGYWGDFINAWPKKLFENVVDFDASNDKVYVKAYNTDISNSAYTKSIPIWLDGYGTTLDLTKDLSFYETKTNKVRMVTPNTFMQVVTLESGWEKVY